MNRLVFFLLFFISLHVNAQKEASVFFDFSNPIGLNPSITPLEGNGQIVIVNDTTFINGPIQINFDKGDILSGSGVQIITIVSGNDTTYALKITNTAKIKFTSINGTTLNRIELTENSLSGDISVIRDEKYKGDIKLGTWKSLSDTPIDNVTFVNSGYPSLWTGLTVYYMTPSAILKPVNVSIENNTEIPEFNYIDLSFEDNLKILDASGITILNGTDTIANSVGKDYKGNTLSKINASSIDNVIKVSVDTPITKDGTYLLTIPVKSFESEDGYHNAELKYTFTVKTPKNTLNFIETKPEAGRVDTLKSRIILTFNEDVLINDTAKIVLNKDNNPYRPLKVDTVFGNNKQVSLKFLNITDDITELGVYTIKIPEGTIYNAFKDVDKDLERYNPAFTLEYIISNDPPEDTDVMKAAKALLLKSGLGYPKETSAKRLALKALTEAEDIPTDDQLTAAIGEFYNETDVVLPDSGIWYTIASVNANGDKLYLYYNDGTVTLTDDAKKATAFMADSLKASTSFKTIDGKYLHVLSAAQDGKFDATSSKNVTETYDSLVNNLVLTKLAVKEVDSVKTFGLFSLYGSLGKDIISEVPMSTYAQISHTNKTVISDPNYPLLYTENNTGAFVLEQTEKPEILAEPVKLACSLNPSIVADNSELITLSFVSDTTVYLSTDTAAYITKKGSDKKVVEEVVFTGVSNNSFTFAVAGLEKGNYELVIPDGLFYVMTKAGLKALIIPENRKLPFSIGKQGSGDDDGFDYNYISHSVYNEQASEYVSDEIFNNFVIYNVGYYDGLVADSTKKVILTYSFNPTDTIAIGHFKSYVIPGLEENGAIKLVLNKEIKNLKAETYAIIIEKATFGDNNFGKYLKDRTSVKASDCKVNPRIVKNYKVNNDIVSSEIDSISIDKYSNVQIYDLFGRKLDKITKNGIYIINGKKVVVRNKNK